jgi:hypothetical protein
MPVTTARMLATLILLGSGSLARADEEPRAAAPARASEGAVDLTPRPVEFIAPGTVIGNGAPKGWSHLVMIAAPRIGAGDVNSVPRAAARFSSMLFFTMVANVRAEQTDEGPRYSLDRVAIGSALEIDGRKIIATSERTFGKDLGFIGRRVLEENETILKSDVRQTARTRTMMVVDAKGYIVYNKKHAPMVIRHALVVSPRDGSLATFVWLLGSDGAGGYALAERSLQLLPPNMQEDRVLSVDGSKFTLGIPSNDAFALLHISQGTPVRFNAAMNTLAVTRRMTEQSVRQLEAELQAHYAPLLTRIRDQSRLNR